MIRRLALAGLLPLLAAGVALSGLARAQDVINNGQLYPYGEQQTTERVEDPGIDEDLVWKITTTGQGNPWDGGGASPVVQPIKAGDRITAAAYLRADAPATVPMLLMKPEPDWDEYARADAEVGTEWEIHSVSMVADRDFPVGSLNYGMQFNAGENTIYVGPVVVVNRGQ